MSDEKILLAHGSGGRLTHDLIQQLLLPRFSNPILNLLEDSAKISHPQGILAFTTDSYVVNPLFFPGGDIGKLAVYGTVNDLSVVGATPSHLSLSLILEEGLPIDLLQRIVASIQEAAEQAGVAIVTGDTKVVEHGKGDQLFITTSGIGWIKAGINLSSNRAKPGDIGDDRLPIELRTQGGEIATQNDLPGRRGAEGIDTAGERWDGYPLPLGAIPAEERPA